jgi:hypothetical protein
MFWKLNGRSDQFYLVFFGLWCFLTGYLIFRSAFMPKVIGILLSISLAMGGPRERQLVGRV